MNEETVAAVVITFQRRDMLRRTLEGLRAQERPVDEIVVIDNGTTDGTAAMLVEEFPDVTHLRMEENIGPAGALEVGFDYAHGKGHRWAWTHSDDILAKPEALKTLLATAEQLGDDRLGLLAAGSSRSAPTTATTAPSGRPGSSSSSGRRWAARPTRPT